MWMGWLGVIVAGFGTAWSVYLRSLLFVINHHESSIAADAAENRASMSANKAIVFTNNPANTKNSAELVAPPVFLHTSSRQPSIHERFRMFVIFSW